MRKALSLLMAIIFILIIGVIGGLTLQLLSTATTQTTNTYLYAQAQMLLQSARELAILVVSGHSIKDTNKCVKDIKINYNDTFDIAIDVHYIGSGFPSACDPQMLYNNLQHKESNLTLLLDISVTLRPSILAGQPLRLFQRTLQKL